MSRADDAPELAASVATTKHQCPVCGSGRYGPAHWSISGVPVAACRLAERAIRDGLPIKFHCQKCGTTAEERL